MRDGSALRPTQQSRTLCSGIKAEFNTAEGPEHVVIVGGGSLGSLFAGRLGAIKSLRDRVWLLTSWEEQAKAVEENQGLIVQEEGQVGNKCLMGQVQVVREPSQVSREIYKLQNAGLRGKANVVILAVKQPSIRKAAEQAATILADVHGGVCVTLLNGLGHIETVRNTFRNNDVQATLVHGVFTGGAHIRDVGMVQHVGKGQLSLAVVGGKPDPLTCQLLEEVGNALHASGIDTSFVTHVLPLAWDKLCVNVAINALTALLGVSNGRLLESDDCKDIMRDAVREAHAVACRVLSRELGETEAATCALVKDGWQASADKALRVAEMTAGNRSSMLCDIETRRPTEVEAIYGSVVGEGDREVLSILGVQGLPACLCACMCASDAANDSIRGCLATDV
jgi:2-dehydropantoate 2-reductase